MKHEILPQDKRDLQAARLWVRLLRDNVNTLSDEYSLMTPESLAIAKIGERLNPVLVALDDLIGPE